MKLEPSGTSTMELIVNGFDYFRKNPIITLRLGSKYASVIINLILTSATQLYSKITKINEIFIATPHFYLKLRNLEKKVLIFRRSSLTAHKDKLMSRGILSPAKF